MAYKIKSRVSAFKMSKTSEPHYTNLERIPIITYKETKGKRLIGHAKEGDYYVGVDGKSYLYKGEEIMADIINKKRSWTIDNNFKVTTLPNEKILAKDGKWYLVSYKNPTTNKKSYAISDGWKVDFLVVRSDGDVAYDRPEAIPERIRNKFEKKIDYGI